MTDLPSVGLQMPITRIHLRPLLHHLPVVAVFDAYFQWHCSGDFGFHLPSAWSDRGRLRVECLAAFHHHPHLAQLGKRRGERLRPGKRSSLLPVPRDASGVGGEMVQSWVSSTGSTPIPFHCDVGYFCRYFWSFWKLGSN